MTEPTLPSAPTGWTFGTASVSGSPATIVKGVATEAVLVTVTNTISRDQGFLKIKKEFNPLTSGFAGNFTIHYDCGGTNTGNVNLAAGATSAAIGPFDTGTSCTVTEPTLPSAPTGWTFGTASVSGSPATIVKGVATEAVLVTVTNTISRDTGSLLVRKTLTGGPGAPGYDPDYTISWNCNDGDGAPFDGSTTVKAGAAAVTARTGIPTGTQCTVSETLPGAPTGYSFSAPTYDPSATVTIATNGQEVTVTVQNILTRDTGNLKISKVLDVGGSNFDTATTFDINYECKIGADITKSGSISIAGASSSTITGIPTGSVCTVTEPTQPGAPTGYSWSVSVTGSPTSAIAKNTTEEAKVYNTLTRDTGNLKISKVLDVGGSNFDTATTFDINYECKIGADITKSGSISIAGASSSTITGIPTGSVCTVTEPTQPGAPTGYSWSVSVTGSPTSAIAKNTTEEAKVYNTLTRDTGSLKVRKTLTGGPGAPGYDPDYTISWNCNDGDGAPFDGSTTVKAGAAAVLARTGIPTGTQCTVSETLPGAPTGYSFSNPTYDPSATVTIATNGQVVTVTVQNTLTRDTGSLLVRKTLTGGPATGYDPDYTISWDCNDGVGAPYDGSTTVKAGAAAVTARTGIPTGTQCTVSETLPTVPTGYSFSNPTYDPSATVTIATKDQEVTVTVQNTLTRDTGSLKVKKTLTGGPGAPGYDPDYTISWNCNDGVGAPYDGSTTVKAGATAVLARTGIPTGTQCTVSETLPTVPPGYSFSAPTYDPSATVTIATNGQEVTVTVQNTLTRDQGFLKISKVFDAKTSGFNGTFTIHYNCGAGDQTVSLAAGATSSAIGPFDTGTNCVVTEPTLPSAPTGWTFGTTPTFNPVGADSTGVTITKGDQAAAVTVSVTNTITRDTGSFKITKVLNPGGSGFNTNTLFTINYTCKIGTTTTASGSVQLKGGQSQTINGIPTGSVCTVTEPTQPGAPTGYSWWVTISPTSVTITKDASPIPEVIVTNSLRADRADARVLEEPPGRGLRPHRWWRGEARQLRREQQDACHEGVQRDELLEQQAERRDRLPRWPPARHGVQPAQWHRHVHRGRPRQGRRVP